MTEDRREIAEGRRAYLFPGQGSQYIGMGKEFYENFNIARDVFGQANETLGYDLARICLEGPLERLSKTQYTQAAILAVSLASYQVLSQFPNFVKPAYVAGHSLGEYTALCASGAVSFKDALFLVKERGKLMEEEAKRHPGGMAAILGLGQEEVEEVCSLVKEDRTLSLANLNCPGQIVISGEEEVLKKAMDLAKERGAGRVVRLNVSGAFHSPLMENAAKRFSEVLEGIDIRPLGVAVVSNVEARAIGDSGRIKRLLEKQITSVVKWEQSIRFMIEQGVDCFIEVGPGRVLSGLVRRISKEVTIRNVEDLKSLEAMKDVT